MSVTDPAKDPRAMSLSELEATYPELLRRTVAPAEEDTESLRCDWVLTLPHDKCLTPQPK